VAIHLNCHVIYLFIYRYKDRKSLQNVCVKTARRWAKCVGIRYQLQAYIFPSALILTKRFRYTAATYTGRSPVGRRPTGVAHSKITRVRVLSWPLSVLTSLYFLTVTKSGDESLVFVVAELVSNQFKAIKKISAFSVNNGKKYFIRVL